MMVSFQQHPSRKARANRKAVKMTDYDLPSHDRRCTVTPQAFCPGELVRFWSDRVFGIPAQGKVVKVGRKYVHIEAHCVAMRNGRCVIVRWTAKVDPSRILI